MELKYTRWNGQQAALPKNQLKKNQWIICKIMVQMCELGWRVKKQKEI